MVAKPGLVGLVGLGITSLSSALSPAHAEEIDLGEIVVTAGLAPVEEEKVGRAYTVLSGEELQRSQTRYLADALRMVPGVAVGRTGSYGGLTSIRMRGGESRHVLVLMDGVEISGTSDGSYDFGGLLVTDIDRIEVLRGPQSALYGSDAVDGVIHIITRGGQRDGNQLTAKTELGTDGTKLVNLGLSGGRERFDYAFSGAFRQTDGFNISDDGSEDDGDRNVTLTGKVRADLTDDLKFDANIRYVNRDSDTDDQSWATGLATDTPDSFTKTDEFSGAAGLIWSLFDDQLVQKLKGKYSQTGRRGLSSGSYNGFDGARSDLSYQTTFFFDTEHLAEAGTA